MRVGPAKFTRGGDVTFATYGNGQTAILIMADGEREAVATVNLEGLGAPEPTMASCPKCGKYRVPKPQGKPRSCKRCGVLATSFGLQRHGAPSQ